MNKDIFKFCCSQQINLFQFIQIKMMILKDLKHEGVNYQKVIKNYNVIANGKNLFDQPNNSEIKPYEEVQ